MALLFLPFPLTASLRYRIPASPLRASTTAADFQRFPLVLFLPFYSFPLPRFLLLLPPHPPPPPQSGYRTTQRLHPPSFSSSLSLFSCHVFSSPFSVPTTPLGPLRSFRLTSTLSPFDFKVLNPAPTRTPSVELLFEHYCPAPALRKTLYRCGLPFVRFLPETGTPFTSHAYPPTFDSLTPGRVATPVAPANHTPYPNIHSFYLSTLSQDARNL